MKKSLFIIGAISVLSFINVNAQTVTGSLAVGTEPANNSGIDPTKIAYFQNEPNTSNGVFIHNSGSTTMGNKNTENTKALLELSATNKGFLPTRLTTAEITALNAGANEIGMVVYDTTKKCLSVYNGTTWSCAGESNTTGGTGTYNSPATSCRSILGTNPSATDGEYWLTAAGTKFKTLCDMTNGGYTLLWSYSEKTAIDIYNQEATGSAIVYTIPLSTNSPYNFPNDNGANTPINYENFRLSKPVAKAVRQSAGNTDYYSTYRVRVTNTPNAAPNDALGQNFSLTTYNSTSAVDFLDTSFVTKTGIKSNGTYGGKTLVQPGTGPTDNTFGGKASAYLVWHNAGATFLDFPNSNDYSIFATKGANLFGYYGETPTDGLEWGKCSNPATTITGYDGLKYCDGNTVKTTNSPVRYTQWWVK